MNSKLLVIVSIIFGLFLSALIVLNGRLLLLAIPFLVYIFVGYFQAPGEIKLRADRTIEHHGAVSHQPIETRIVIENEGNPLANLFLSDSIFPLMTIQEGNASQRLSLSGGESTEINYVFQANRGVYTWNTIHACASDPFGLFESECSIPASGEVFIRPMSKRLRNVMLKPRATIHTAGSMQARLAGSGTDFWGIREYQSGDSLRRINWRLAARHPQKLFANDYEQEEIADFGLILDARKLSNADAMEEALFEHSVSAVGALAENFLRNGNRVSHLVFGETISLVFPGFGKKHLQVLQNNLAGVRQGPYLPFRYFEGFLTRLFSPKSQIVIISVFDVRDQDTYARMLSLGHSVLLISPDPVDFTFRTNPQTEISTLASRAAKVDRTIQLNQLLKMGVNVIDWQVEQQLDKVIYMAINNPGRRRNIRGQG